MYNAVVIGSGNVAFHFIPAFKKIKEINISCILTRSRSKALFLKDYQDIQVISTVDEIPLDTDLIFLMVNDDSIQPLSDLLKKNLPSSTIIIHFSGSKGLDEISDYFENKGIMWPIQSISSTDHELEISNIPISTSFSNRYMEGVLKKWVASMGGILYQLSEKEKKTVHLSAVFANNFTNHLYVIAKEILENENLDYELIKPLILKTAQKAILNCPSKNQTGPAIRNDQAVMNAQINRISNPEHKEIYQLISETITKKYNK